MLKFAVRMHCRDYPIFAPIAEEMGYYWMDEYTEGGRKKPTQYNPVNAGYHKNSKICIVFGYFSQEPKRLGWCSADYIYKIEYISMSLDEFVEKFGDDQEVETEEISIYQLME